MRCSLATVLLQETDILILDEPTNFLDLLGIMWLQRFLLNLSETTDTTVLLVSHDRDFIDAVCPETILLRDRTLNYFRGTFSAYEKDRRMQILHLSRMQEAQDRQKAHIEKTIAQNMKAGKAAGDENKLRQAKSRQKKLDDRWGMSVSAKGGRFKLNRDITGFHLRSREEIDIPTEERSIAIFIPPAPDLRFPGPLISLENVSFRYPISKTKGMSKTEAATAAAAQKDVLTDVTLTIHAGDRIGVLGLNGSGKSTLINLITGATTPSKGTASFHPRLRMGYYSQHAVTTLQTLGATNPSLTALAHLTALTSTSASAESESQFSEQDLRGLLGSLGLPGRIASDIPIAKLSGGQLVRLALAELLWKEPQILVLDEVSTHLDFYTVDALGAALGAWNGAVVLVSHDRSFVRRVVEGVRDEEEESDEEQEEDAEGEVPRRREVFLMKGGKMTRLSGGVSEFEKSLERRIAKLSLG
jgi:ATPase subunit of ABC transporter with duplicated ATPase domains